MAMANSSFTFWNFLEFLNPWIRRARTWRADCIPVHLEGRGSRILTEKGEVFQAGGPGPGSPLAKEGPGLLVGAPQHCPVSLAAPQLVPEQLLSCFPAASPLVSAITGDNPVPDVQAPEQTVHLGSCHPSACPCAHGDGRPRPPRPAPGPDLRPSRPPRPAAVTPLGTWGEPLPRTSPGPGPWISPGVALTVLPCEALWP